MVDTNALRAEWVKKGLTQNQVAKSIGISSKTMTNRMKSKVFGTDEANDIILLLDIENPADIFPAQE